MSALLPLSHHSAVLHAIIFFVILQSTCHRTLVHHRHCFHDVFDRLRIPPWHQCNCTALPAVNFTLRRSTRPMIETTDFPPSGCRASPPFEYLSL
ncbi:hypothetical protein EDB19DRAFT_1754637 [Suillus lakei]|nr:hypothetical protein EDB19DRAFT_1754637 [Suillus lakei]